MNRYTSSLKKVQEQSISCCRKGMLMAIVFVVLMGVLLFHPTNTQPGDVGENAEGSVQWVRSQPVEVAVNWNEKSFTQVITSPASTSATQATATGGNK